MPNLSKKIYLNLILIICVTSLIAAFFIEYILGHKPCNLCLIERIPYVLGIVILIINYKFNDFEKFFILLLAIIFLISVLLSMYHFGIEQGFIEESLVCDLKNGSKIFSKEELLKELQKQTINCKNVTFTIFGLSLTTFNIMISLIITYILTKLYFNYEKN